jgi:DNA polymerase-3 subunit gamma/tau
MLGSVDHKLIARLLTALAAHDGDALMAIVQELASLSRDFETVLSELAEVLHRMGLVQLVPAYTDPERADWPSIEALAQKLSPEDVQLYYQIAIQGRRDMSLAPNPRTGLEMTLLRMLAFRPATAAGPGASGASQSGAGQATSTSEDGASNNAPVAHAGTRAAAEPPAAAPVDKAPVSVAPAEARELDWRALLERLKLKGPVRELARNIQLDRREGDNWNFLIPDEVKYLGSERLVSELQSELSTQLGQPVRLALNPVKEHVSSPALVEEQAQVRQLSDAERAISDDPTVQSLKERFGARILNDSIQPLQ